MSNTQSVDFERSSEQFASITNAAQSNLNIAGDITVETWIKIETLSSVAGIAYGLVMKWLDSGGGQRQYQLIINTNDKPTFVFTDSGGNISNSAVDATPVAGVWTHVAVTVDVSIPNWTFYINGVETSDTVSVSNATSIRTDGAAEFGIGAVNTNSGTEGNFYDGLMDEVRVWDTIRTAQEISGSYRRQLVGNEPNLQFYGRLNGDFTDETSNGNNLTSSGSPVFVNDVPPFANAFIMVF